MFKRILKAIGTWAFVTGVIYLIVDIWRSISSTSFSLRSLGQAWAEVSFESQHALQVVLSNGLGQPQMWDFVAGVLLRFTPASAFFIVIGLLFYWVGKPKSSSTRHKKQKSLAEEFTG